MKVALPHAPAAANDGSQPARVDSGSTLGRRDPSYSLAALLGGASGSVWLRGGNAWAELIAEYRKIARHAAGHGDYRRAAYIYGVLLRDLRMAADTLAAGGLHRDAAILYRDRVNEPTAAAAAFERAGDLDEALRLYRQTGQFAVPATCSAGWAMRHGRWKCSSPPRIGWPDRAPTSLPATCCEIRRAGPIWRWPTT